MVAGKWSTSDAGVTLMNLQSRCYICLLWKKQSTLEKVLCALQNKLWGSHAHSRRNVIYSNSYIKIRIVILK